MAMQLNHRAKKNQHKMMPLSCSNIDSESSPSSCLTNSQNKNKKMMMKMKMMQSSHTATPPWSMSSLYTALPGSPSPSPLTRQQRHPPHQHTIIYSDNYNNTTEEFSTPRTQEFGVDNNKGCSICFSEIDEWLEQANKFCRSHIYEESVHMRRDENPEEDLRIYAVCNRFHTVTDHELHNITLPSIREQSPVVFHGETDLNCVNSKYEAFRFGSNDRRRFLRRPRPYEEFLNEVRRKEQEAEREACRKAKHVELMHRMRRKEEAIHDWEMQQTRKAMDKMDKIQSELERKQRMASDNTQKKLCLVREKAEKQKLSLRRSAMKKCQQLQNTTEISWSSHLPLC